MNPRFRHLLVVSDLQRSIDFYTTMLQAEVTTQWEGYACLELFGNILHLIDPGGPTPDKPDVSYVAPQSARLATHEVVIEVDDCRSFYETLVERGVVFMSAPTVPPWGTEVRCFFSDPDGHLFEVTQDLSRQ